MCGACRQACRPLGGERSCQGLPVSYFCCKYPLTQPCVFLILGQLGVTISHASLGRALLRVFRCLQSCKQCSRASEAAISETPRWAGGRSLKQNCQSKELVPLATVMLEIGLREGAKKHAQKSSYQLFAVKLEEGPGRRGHPARLRSPLPCTGGRPKTAGSE